MKTFKLLLLAVGLIAGMTNVSKCSDQISKRSTYEPSLSERAAQDAEQAQQEAEEAAAQDQIVNAFKAEITDKIKTFSTKVKEFREHASYSSLAREILDIDFAQFNLEIDTIQEIISCMKRYNKLDEQRYEYLEVFISEVKKHTRNLYDSSLRSIEEQQ